VNSDHSNSKNYQNCKSDISSDKFQIAAQNIGKKAKTLQNDSEEETDIKVEIGMVNKYLIENSHNSNDS